MGWPAGNKFDVEEVEAIYELGDSNGDNVLDLGEFIAIMFPAAGEALAKLRQEDTFYLPSKIYLLIFLFLPFAHGIYVLSSQIFPWMLLIRNFFML